MQLLKISNYPGYVRKLWWLVRSRLVFILSGCTMGPKVAFNGIPIVSRCANSTIKLGARVGLTSDSGYTALGVSHPVILRTLRPGATLEIGSDTGLSGTTICAAVSISIGQRCLIGADVMIVDTDFHPIDPKGRRYANEASARAKPISIGDDVFIGTRSIILPGVTIGNGSVVGAGSVVTHAIPPFSVCAGNPARILRTLAS